MADTNKQIESSNKSAEVEKMAQVEKINYVLYLRHGSNPHPKMKIFQHPKASIQVLVERCKNYCTNMGYRFVSVEPMLSDLSEEEKKHQAG